MEYVVRKIPENMRIFEANRKKIGEHNAGLHTIGPIHLHNCIKELMPEAKSWAPKYFCPFSYSDTKLNEAELKSYPEVDSVLVIFQDPFYHDNEEISNVERFIEAFPFLFSLEILAETLFLPLDQHRAFLVRYQESILRFWKKCYFCLNKSYLTLFECISISLFYQNDFSSFLNQGLYDPRLFFLIISMVPEVASLYAADSETDDDYF
jgi:hypothetical protein